MEALSLLVLSEAGCTVSCFLNMGDVGMIYKLFWLSTTHSVVNSEFLLMNSKFRSNKRIAASTILTGPRAIQVNSIPFLWFS